jgi:hypothetical protein
MVNLEETWFYEPPIDFEHKNYLLLQYLSDIDKSYSLFRLSPYLLRTERLIGSMKIFREDLKKQKSLIVGRMIGFSFQRGIIREDVEDIPEMEEISEIVDYSIPLLDSKVKMGYKLLKKYPQVLFI